MPDRLRVSGFGRENALGKRVQDPQTEEKYTLTHIGRKSAVCEDSERSRINFSLRYLDRFYVLNPWSIKVYKNLKTKAFLLKNGRISKL